MEHKLIVHIGLPKTGTTALQHFLFNNSEELRNHGYIYPDGNELYCQELLGIREKHGELILLADMSQSIDSISRETERRMERIKRYLQDFDVILSEEGLAGRLYENRLQEFFGHFSGVNIIVYLRRQDRWIESLYNQWIKMFRTDEDFDVFIETQVPGWLHYDRLLESLAERFGRDHIVVRIYEKDQFKGGKIETDFLSVLGIDTEISKWRFYDNQNERIYGNIEEICKFMSQGKVWKQFVTAQEYWNFFAMLSRKFCDDQKETGYFSTEKRRDFLEKFEDGNRYIARTYMKRENEVLFYDRNTDIPVRSTDNLDSQDFIRDVIRTFGMLFMSIDNRVSGLESKLGDMKKMGTALIIEKAHGRKLVLFGAGYRGERIIKETELKFDAVIDNDSKRVGVEFLGYVIASPTEYSKKEDTFVVISPELSYEIIRQLEMDGWKKDVDFVLAQDYLSVVF